MSAVTAQDCNPHFMRLPALLCKKRTDPWALEDVLPVTFVPEHHATQMMSTQMGPLSSTAQAQEPRKGFNTPALNIPNGNHLSPIMKCSQVASRREVLHLGSPLCAFNEKAISETLLLFLTVLITLHSSHIFLNTFPIRYVASPLT